MALKLRTWRWLVQYSSFFLLMYGGRFGVRLGSALPCFACPYVAGCGGYCYLMGFQGYIGFGMSAAAITGAWLLTAAGWLLLFIVLVALLGKTWCGWICPFGLLQDWATALRRSLGIRERHFSTKIRPMVDSIKYGLLVYLIIVPPLVTLGFLHEDFYLPFCNICPGKSLLPLFAGETRYLAVNLNNQITTGFSIALLIITGITLIGMFFKDRFFCVLCPMLALIHIFSFCTILRLVKNTKACLGCGNCRRACPVDIEAVYRERQSHNVQTGTCLDCCSCAEACPSDYSISLKFWKWNLFKSSRTYAAGLIRKG